MKKFVVVLFVAVLALTAVFANGSSERTAPAASSAPLLFRVSMPEAATDNKALAIQQVVKGIEEKTQGRVKFEVYYNGELGTFTDTIEGISLGSNIIDGTSGDAWAPYGSPDMTALNLMYLYPDSASVQRFNRSDLFKQMQDELEKNSGIKVVAMNWCCAPREVLSTKPINSVADLKGIMIRVPLPPYVAFFKRLGASTVNMTMSEVYTGMQQGMLDACEFPLNTIYTNSLQEVAKYVYLSDHTYAPCVWGLSAALFNKMSPEDQKVFVDEFEAGGEYFTKLNEDNMQEYKEKLQAAGVKFVTPSEADKAVMRQAATDAVKDFPELSEGLIDRVKAAMAE
jgi:TRAP-type C4-dicarboxylate transport system substrate-binding protein